MAVDFNKSWLVAKMSHGRLTNLRKQEDRDSELVVIASIPSARHGGGNAAG